MKKVSFIGVYDKTDLILSIAKVLTKALVILVPTIIITIAITATNYLLMFILLLFEIFI